MIKTLTGGCLCGAVNFSLKDSFQSFYFCHCQQCKQLTGSAFAANLATDKSNITWLSGQDKVSNYEHPSRNFSKAFCRQCGSALPFINKTGTSLVVPAGSLNDPPEMKPQANIFIAEEALWLSDASKVKNFLGFASN